MNDLLTGERLEIHGMPVHAPGGTIGHEVLMRSSDGTSPMTLLQRARAESVVPQLDAAVFRQALCHDPFTDGRMLFVNVDRESLVDSHWQDVVLRCLKKIPTQYAICFEVTEHENVGQLANSIERIRSCSSVNPTVRFALDDMGSGYANLDILFTIKPKIVKLDRSVVKNLENEPDRQFFLKALQDFADETDTLIVAEGVETRQQLDRLSEQGIRCFQGYYFEEPQPYPRNVLSSETANTTSRGGDVH